jgi:predicted amidohydrolase YtcJ
MPLLAPQIAPGVALMENYLHAAGVTTAAEPGGLPLFYKQQMQILTDEGSPLRFYYIPDGRSLAKKFQGRALLDATEKALLPPEGNVRFLPGHVKLFSDGAMFSQLMQMETGYLDGHQGEWLMEKSIFEQAFRTYWDEGYQIHIHQNGDKGLQRIIDVLSDNLARNPRQDHRTTIVHFGFSSSQQVKALADLGAIVSANPYYTIALAETYSRVGIGPKRAATMVRLGEVVKQGITVSLHSDMPMAPGKPLFLMWAAVNRMTDSGRVYAASQALTPMQALRAVTLDAAYTLRLEDELGSISTGKRADFTILEQHPLEIAKTKIKDIGVAATVVEGKVYAIKK